MEMYKSCLLTNFVIFFYHSRHEIKERIYVALCTGLGSFMHLQTKTFAIWLHLVIKIRIFFFYFKEVLFIKENQNFVSFV